MGSPWNGRRHVSWLSDTVLFAIVFVVVLLVTVVVDATNGSEPAPTYLIGLLGASSAALFGFATSDKSKRDKEIAQDAAITSQTADRAEAKADKLAELAKAEHPDNPELKDMLDGGVS